MLPPIASIFSYTSVYSCYIWLDLFKNVLNLVEICTTRSTFIHASLTCFITHIRSINLCPYSINIDLFCIMTLWLNHRSFPFPFHYIMFLIQRSIIATIFYSISFLRHSTYLNASFAISNILYFVSGLVPARPDLVFIHRSISCSHSH